MTEVIRRIEESDFETAAPLFQIPYRKSVEELKWLFKDPNNEYEYNGFVCVNKGELVGVIGYINSFYTDGTAEYRGVIPMSWQLKENYKGFAGILLFKKVLSFGDFCIAVAGSETAKQLYPIFKYKYLYNIYEYHKILDLTSSFDIVARRYRLKSLAKLVWLLPSRFKTKRQFGSSKKIVFKDYNIEDLSYDNLEKGTIRKKINHNEIKWFLSCPLVSSFAFSVIVDDCFLGVCILYLKNENNYLQGRIVHLPFLDDKNIIGQIIYECLNFFRKNNCYNVTSWLHHDFFINALKDAGFMRFKNKKIPFYLKDITGVLENHDLDNWFLQYSEGDKSYRNFPNY